jgi:hypothetical protein
VQSILSLKRAYLLAALALLLTLLSARFAFWNTWQAWQLNKQLNSSVGEGAIVSFQPGYLERKSKNLSEALGLYQVDTSAYRNTLLTSISTLAEQEKVDIVDLPTENSNAYYQTKSFKIEKIEFQGAYANLLRFYYKFYQLPHIGMIRSVQLSTTREQEKVKDGCRLQMLLYFEIKR